MADISGSLFTNEYRDRHIAGKSAKKGIQKGVGSVSVTAAKFRGPQPGNADPLGLPCSALTPQTP